jgi:hypothetical protein
MSGIFELTSTRGLLYAGLIETLELGLETEAIVAALQTARGSEI